jgi:N-ethylmaleimide reductase
MLNDGLADMIGFGRPFAGNPDLPNRIKHNDPLAVQDPDTLLGGAEKGLTNYPLYTP